MPDPTSNPRTSDHLANERTFLAWIRTSISVIGLGFVVAKFSVWLRQLSTQMDSNKPVEHTGLSLPLGIGMMTAGGLLALLAASRFRRVNRAIELGLPSTGQNAVTSVTVLILVITAALVTYMFATG